MRKLFRTCEKYDVLVVPGDSFGCTGYVRVSYCVSEQTIKRRAAGICRDHEGISGAEIRAESIRGHPKIIPESGCIHEEKNEG